MPFYPSLKPHWPALLVILTSILISICSYSDYGIGWDEEAQRLIGIEYYKCYTGERASVSDYSERDHGAAFEVLLIVIEKATGLENFRDVFMMRHIVAFIIYLTLMICGYVLVYKLFRNNTLATITLIALIFHPRLYVHAFLNTKDIPAASAYLLAIATSRWALTNKKPFPYILLGIVCGYGTGIRLMGAFIMLPLCAFLIIDIVRSIKNKKLLTISSINLFCLLSFFAVTLYAVWPTLWQKPFHSLLEVFHSLAQYRLPIEQRFAGMQVWNTELPWYYVPLWMLLTTPELWLIAGIGGTILLMIRFATKPLFYITETRSRVFILMLISFIGPLLIIISLQAVMYDGWRHMYFIYPPFVLLAAYGLNDVVVKGYKVPVYIICAIQITYIGVVMVRNHPYQHTYFNSFISHKENKLLEHFEMDYWGTSNYQALQWLAKHSDKQKININFGTYPLHANMHFSPDSIRNRFVLTPEKENQDYHIEFFRTTSYIFPNSQYPNAKVIHRERAFGSTILQITKMR